MTPIWLCLIGLIVAILYLCLVIRDLMRRVDELEQAEILRQEREGAARQRLTRIAEVW